MSSEKHQLRGLVIAPFGITPAVEGSRVHVDAHIRQLKEMGHEVWYLAAGQVEADVAAMKHEWKDRVFHASEKQSDLLPKRWRGIRRRIRAWRRQPPQLDYWFKPAWIETARDLVSRVEFDYVIVHYIFLTRFLEVFPPSVLKIVDTHDSFACLGSKLSAQGVGYKWWHCSQADEIKGLQRGDCIMANQPEEAALFERSLQGSRKIVTVGHPCAWNPWPEPPQLALGLLTTGNSMNRAGLLWFLEECWPLVRRALPDVSLIIGGLICNFPGPWHSTPGVRIIGEVEDVSEFHQLTTVEINPTSAGSGLKIKTMESLAAGRALVSVSEGVTGLSRDFDAFVVADEPDQFAAAVIRLLQNPEERSRLHLNAQRLLKAWNERQQAALGSLFEGCGGS